MTQKRSPAYFPEQHTKPYSINLWSSHPDDNNDDCNTGVDFDTREEAEKVFRSAEPIKALAAIVDAERAENGCPSFAVYYNETPFIEIDGPDINEVRKLREPKKSRDDDGEWRRERAMQAGMGLGIDAYNEEMGYD